MSAYIDNSKRSDAWRFPQPLQNKSVFSFIKTLEKVFFAEVTVQNCGYLDNSFSLAVQLDCNLSLLEVLNHANLGTWGNFKNENDTTPFNNAIKTLQQTNNCLVTINEFSIFLKDTSIIINKTNSNNIPKELNSILKEIASQYIYLTKGLTQKPYEIYIPVLEENDFDVEIYNPQKNTPKNYKEYWGVYFDSEDDPEIYDTTENLYIPEELHLCMIDY